MSHRARRIVMIVVSVALTVGAARAPQAHASAEHDQDQDRLEVDLREYDALVENYRRGDQEAVKRLASWTPRRFGIISLVVGKPHGGDSSWSARRLAAAAMLHTDAARLLMDSNDTAGVSLHLAVAARLLESGAPALDTLARHWYVVVARVLRDRAWLSAADALLGVGRKRLRGDAVVFCESGTLAELLATDRETTIPAGTTLPSRAGFLLEAFERRRMGELARASRWLEQGAEAGAPDALCRLHLGRVRALLEDDRTARSILGELQLGPDVSVGYLASMFLGALAERRNERDEAERCYRIALARFSGGQSAQLALASVLLASGRSAEARTLLAEAIDRDENSRRDPWWWYHFEPRELVETNYTTLRREALR